MPDDNLSLNQLEIEVEAELTIARSAHADQQFGSDPAEWAYDPTDVEREEVGLRSLLGAITALEADSRSTPPTTAPGNLPSE